MMKRKIGLILLLLMHAATEEDPIICPQSRDEAAVGEDVTLSCHLEPQHNVTGELFEWKFNKSVIVLVYKSGGFPAVDQADQFKGRASFDSSGNLSEGKLSVKISNVTTADAGIYSCSVGSGENRKSCSTELTIVDIKEVAEDPPKRGGTSIGTGAIVGIVVGIVAIVAIVGAIAIWRKCGKTSACAGRDRRGRQNTEGSQENNQETMSLNNMGNTNNTNTSHNDEKRCLYQLTVTVT